MIAVRTKPAAQAVSSLPPIPRDRPAGYTASAWCRACQHTRRLDLGALTAGGHGNVPLVHLPLRCRCGSDQFGIIVGAISTAKWQPGRTVRRRPADTR